ncbi:MAG: PucR family transcriptional regulator [Conexibacter sp.]
MTLQQQLTVVSNALRGRLDELCGRLLARTQRELPGLWDASVAGFEHTLRRGLEDHLEGAIHELGRGREPLAELTPRMLEEVQAFARARLSLDDLMQTRRLAHAVLLEALMDEVYGTELGAVAHADLMKASSRFLFAYVDCALPLLRAAYERERTTGQGDRSRRRERLVKDVLSGLPVDPADLGYDLRGRHLCAVAWGVAPGAAIDALVAALGVREHLLVTTSRSSVQAWLSIPSGRCEPAPAVPAGTACAIGEPAEGVEGFRVTHRQANSAYRVGLRRPPGSLTRYRDVALVALAVVDDAAADDFVTHWLGPLAADDPRMAVLRTTLSTYFAVGQNALAAAARLGVNDRTVAYRLRRIEEQVLEEPIAARRDELAVALRLHALACESRESR